MIQRKQSIFLVLVFVALCACCASPLMAVEPEGMGTYSYLFAMGVLHAGQSTPCLANALLCLCQFAAATLALYTIFLYHNRPRQARYCTAGIWLCVAWYVVMTLAYVGVLPVAKGEAHLKFAVCLPAVALILFVMARKGVRDDEKLVRAADRIR